MTRDYLATASKWITLAAFIGGAWIVGRGLFWLVPLIREGL